MLSFKRTIYQCEHCRKRGMHAGLMRRHIIRCTRNPERVCGFCERRGDLEEHILWMIGEMRGAIEKRSISGDALFKRMDGCPACTLAVIVQARARFRDPYLEFLIPMHVEYEYKEAKRKWWVDHPLYEGGTMG